MPAKNEIGNIAKSNQQSYVQVLNDLSWLMTSVKMRQPTILARVNDDPTKFYLSDQSSTHNTIRLVDTVSKSVKTIVSVPIAGPEIISGIAEIDNYIYFCMDNVSGNSHAIYRALRLTGGAYTVFAGTPGTSGYVNGPASSALFNTLSSLCANPQAGILYVCDRGNRVVRAIDVSALTVSLFAGTPGVIGDVDGLPGVAQFGFLDAIDSDNGPIATSTVWVAYQIPGLGSRIKRVAANTGLVTWVAGAGGGGSPTDNATGTLAEMRVTSLTVDKAPTSSPGTRYLYFTSFPHSIVRRMDTVAPYGVSTIAGDLAGGSSGVIDGPYGASRITSPQGIVVLGGDGVTVPQQQNLSIYFVERTIDSIRRIKSAVTPFNVSRFLGNGASTTLYKDSGSISITPNMTAIPGLDSSALYDNQSGKVAAWRFTGTLAEITIDLSMPVRLFGCAMVNTNIINASVSIDPGTGTFTDVDHYKRDDTDRTVSEDPDCDNWFAWFGSFQTAKPFNPRSVLVKRIKISVNGVLSPPFVSNMAYIGELWLITRWKGVPLSYIEEVPDDVGNATPVDLDVMPTTFQWDERVRFDYIANDLRTEYRQVWSYFKTPQRVFRYAWPHDHEHGARYWRRQISDAKGGVLPALLIPDIHARRFFSGAAGNPPPGLSGAQLTEYLNEHDPASATGAGSEPKDPYSQQRDYGNVIRNRECYVVRFGKGIEYNRKRVSDVKYEIELVEEPKGKVILP